MLRIIGKFSLGALLLALFSCSWFTDFAILNNSTSPVVVECFYDTKSFKQVYLAEAEESGFFSRHKFKKLDVGKYKRSATKRSITYTLQPKKALSVMQILNYSGPDSEKARGFGLLKIRLTTKGQTRQLGPEPKVVTLFERQSNGLYTIKIIP